MGQRDDDIIPEATSRPAGGKVGPATIAPLTAEEAAQLAALGLEPPLTPAPNTKVPRL